MIPVLLNPKPRLFNNFCPKGKGAVLEKIGSSEFRDPLIAPQEVTHSRQFESFHPDFRNLMFGCFKQQSTENSIMSDFFKKRVHYFL